MISAFFFGGVFCPIFEAHIGAQTKFKSSTASPYGGGARNIIFSTFRAQTRNILLRVNHSHQCTTTHVRDFGLIACSSTTILSIVSHIFVRDNCIEWQTNNIK